MSRSYDQNRSTPRRSQPSSKQGFNPYETSYGSSYPAPTRPKSVQSTRRSTAPMDDYQSPTYESHGHGAQVQAQEHIFRTAQASKQMVYDVYGNALIMLEELEKRELKEEGARPLSRSDIHLPSQKAHNKSTIERKIDTQLLLLQSQLESCDKDILDDVTEDMKVKTLEWTSERQANQVKQSKADMYTGKLLEVLVKGKTNHPEEFYKKPSISERDMQKTMGAFMHGNQIRYHLDSSFRQDHSKKAVAPMVRPGAGTGLGVERMIKVRPDMEKDLNHYRPYDNK